MAENNSQKKKIGLALSGGGARGFAHVGVISALEDFGIKPDIISGVSAGSVVAALYASGHTPDEILKLFVDLKFGSFAELSVPKDGFFKMDKFKSFLKKNIPIHNIEDLNIPTKICATDLDHCRSVIFDKGSVPERVVASCSIPIVFKPIKIDGVNYVDGGVLRNLPAWAIRQQCDTLIGVNVSPIVAGKFKPTLIDIAHRSYDMMSKVNAIADIKMCDILIQMRSIAKHNIFGIKGMWEIADKGYNDTMKILTESNIIEK